MEFLVPIVLCAWIPVALLLFRDLPRHRAVAIAFVAAWLFLPNAEYRFYGLPDYGKLTAASLGILFSVLLFDRHRLLTFRTHWVDLPMACFCLLPIASSLSNGLGLWDGLSSAQENVLKWGVPYLLGRLYFDRLTKLKDLALAIVGGGLIYLPLCWIELRMSPQLYHWVYGFRPTRFNASRYGGWRPQVFLDTGLELGMWMTAASLLAIVLWRAGAVKRWFGVPFWPLLLLLLATTVLCKSTGALLLLVGGVIVLAVLPRVGSPWPALVVAAVPLVYVGVRSTDTYDGAELVAWAEAAFGEARARSLEFRFENESMLAARAWQQPLFGWGGWSRGRVHDEFGKDRTIVDGMWIDVFGKMGWAGLSAWLTTFLLIPCWTCCRFARRAWLSSPHGADAVAALGLAMVVLLYAIDCLLNAMVNPVYGLILGALATVTLLPSEVLLPSEAHFREDRDVLPPADPPSGRRRLWPDAQRPPTTTVGRWRDEATFLERRRAGSTPPNAVSP